MSGQSPSVTTVHPVTAPRQNAVKVLALQLAGAIGAAAIPTDLPARLEQSAVRSGGAYQPITGNASHELRTPLAVTQTLLDVARNDPNRDNGELVDAFTPSTPERSICPKHCFC